MAAACRTIGIRPPCQIILVDRLALLRELLQDLLEHLGRIILAAALGALVGPAALLRLHLLHLLHELVDHAHRAAAAAQHTHNTA
jgi:CheY-like chemotaxis protein